MLSLVIACYNEGDKIYKNVETVIYYMEDVIKTKDYEIVLSNDGSKDNTLDEIIRLQNKYKNIKLYNSDKNNGKGKAVQLGVIKSSGDKIIFMDADLATRLYAIEEAYYLLDKYDVVIGSRRIKGSNITKKQPIHRQLVGKSCSFLTSLITGVKFKDTQCGFKGFTRKSADDIFRKQTINGFAFDVEILYIAKLLKYSIKELPVMWENADTTTVKAVRDSFKFFKDIIKIKFNNY